VAADFSKFDCDPDALAWARAKIEQYVTRLADFEQQCAANGDEASVRCFRVVQQHITRHFVGDRGCVIGVFDERLPQFAKSVDGAIPAPIDRAVKRDHSLCGAEPCSDCR
jgi:hypothetical protein